MRSTTPVGVRVWRHVAVAGPDDCWLWTGGVAGGYGVIGVGRREDGKMQAHRAAYESKVGPIPEGHVVDHTCEQLLCCNPAHLEPVTHQDHMLRHEGKRTTCRHGHPLDGICRDRTADGRPRLRRYCKACRRRQVTDRARRAP